MKKNIILLILLIPFLFGCSAEYELTINNNEFKENLKVYAISDSNSMDIVNDNLKYPTPALRSQVVDATTSQRQNGILYYNQKKYQKEDQIGVEYSYLFNKENIYDSNIANTCYKLFSVVKNEETIVLSTDRENQCFSNKQLSDLKVVVRTNHKVKDNNADNVSGGEYTWYIDKNNYNNKTIYIEYYENQYVESTKNTKIVILIIISLAIFSLLVIIFLMKRARSNNKI